MLGTSFSILRWGLEFLEFEQGFLQINRSRDPGVLPFLSQCVFSVKGLP